MKQKFTKQIEADEDAFYFDKKSIKNLTLVDSARSIFEDLRLIKR